MFTVLYYMHGTESNTIVPKILSPSLQGGSKNKAREKDTENPDGNKVSWAKEGEV